MNKLNERFSVQIERLNKEERPERVESKISELWGKNKLNNQDLLDLWDCLNYWDNEVPTSYEDWGVYFDMLNDLKREQRLRFEWTAA